MMETNAPGLHDAILLCAGIAAVYLVVALLQLMQLKRPRSLSLPAREPSVGPSLPMSAEGSKANDDTFADQLKQSTLEAELKRLTHEVDRLHKELRASQDDIKRLRNERSVANVTPLYNEAMSFAKRGFNAAGIAARCGISMGEAELVTALAHDPKQFGLTDENPAQQHDRYRAAA